MNKLELELEGDSVVVARRRFTAPPQAVFRAHTEAELVQQWMLGPDGWTMPVCVCEAKPGGAIRGCAAADAEDDVPGSQVECGPDQLAGALAGGVHRVEPTRVQKRKAGCRRHFDDRQAVCPTVQKRCLDRRTQWTAHLLLHALGLQRTGERLQQAVAAIGNGNQS